MQIDNLPFLYPKTLVIRHVRENLKKCSLKGLESREDMQFLSYPFTELPPLDNYVMLVMEGAPLLSREDQDKGILLLDSTWRYLPKMVKAVEAVTGTGLERRVLPGHFKTAYPRSQEDCIDPGRGLSSLEALFITYWILGRPTEGLLTNYYWKEIFLKINDFT